MRYPVPLPLARLSPLIVVLAVTSCDRSPTAADDTDPDPDPSWPTDWTLAVDPATGIEPGEIVLVGIEGDWPDDAVFWIDAGTDDAYRVPVVQLVYGPSTREVLQIPIPILEPGRHTLYIGTLDGPRSNAVTVDIVMPQRRYAQEEVAGIMQTALSARVDAVLSLVAGSEDSSYAALLEAGFARYREPFEEWLGISRAAAEVAAELYLELPADRELLLQSALHHNGLLERWRQTAEAAATPQASVTAKRETGPGPRRSIPPPVPGLENFPHFAHANFFLFDVMGAMGHAEELALSIIGMAGVNEAVKVAAPGISAIALASGVALRILRFGIQSFVPTEVAGIEPHFQPMVYEHQSIQELWWVELRPQERWSEGIVELTADLIATGLGKGWEKVRANPALPVDEEDVVEAIVKEFLSRVAAKVGVAIVSAPIPESGYAMEVKVLLNPGAYTLWSPAGLAKLSAVVPVIMGPQGYVLAPMLVGSSAMFWIQRMLTPDEFTIDYGLIASSDYDALGVQAADGFAADYWNDEIYFPHLDFTESGPQTTQATVEARTFRLDAATLPFIGDFPWLYAQEPVGHPIQINNYPGDEVADSKPITGQAILLDRWGFSEGSVYDWVVRYDPGSNADRQYRFRIGDSHGVCQDIGQKASARITFENAEPMFYMGGSDWQELEETGVAEEYYMVARPGQSRIIVEAKPAPNCAFETDWGQRMWVELQFPSAVNFYKSYDIRGDEPKQASIIVWTPPCFEPCEAN